MEFLHQRVFDPILNSKKVPANLKSGVNLTIGRMNRLSEQRWFSISGLLLRQIMQ